MASLAISLEPLDTKSTSLPPPDEPVVLRAAEHPLSLANIDPDALKILYRLHRHGFIAYVVGGAVRDMMLGLAPKDFDIGTDARPRQVKRLFANTYLIGRRFRLAHIHFQGDKIIEVATFRKDPEAGDAPEDKLNQNNAFGTPREDAFRRDLTINALFYDVFTSTVIDYVGGLEDIGRRRIRIIGDPGKRFTRDPVCLWRALRYTARLGFEIEKDTAQAIPSHSHLIAACPGARLYEELNKDLRSGAGPMFEALRSYGILRHILGRAGEDYESDPVLFSRLSALLEIMDRAPGLQLSLEEKYALVFWPWVEPMLVETQSEPVKSLHDVFLTARMGVLLPRALRTGFIQILVMLRKMFSALRTGRARPSLRRHSHYAQASRLCFLIAQGRPAEPLETEDPFENLFRKAFPQESKSPKRRRRRRRRRLKPVPEG